MDNDHQIRRPRRSSMSSSSSIGAARNYSRLEFFKVFLPNFSSNKLLIPPDFVKLLKSRSRTIPNKAILQDRNGQEWNVELTKKANRLFIEEGWPDFVNSWSLEFGDFLIFRYFRKKLIFTVKVFARNGCLKELDVLSSETSADRPPGPDIYKIPDVVEVKSDADTPPGPNIDKIPDVVEMKSDADAPPGPVIDKIPDVVEVKSDDEEEETVARGGERHRRPVRVCKKKYLNLNLENLKTSRTSSINYKKITTLPQPPQPPLVQETAPAPPVKCIMPKHPHFVAVMSRNTSKILFLSSIFLKRHNIRLKPQVMLQDEEGSQWPIKIETLYDTRRITMTEGWSEFSGSKNLKVGDNIVLEFILEGENRCKEVHVQICEAGLKTQRVGRYLVAVP